MGKKFKIWVKGDKNSKFLSVKEFENLFGITYTPTLLFDPKIRSEFPISYQIPWIGEELTQNRQKYQKEFLEQQEDGVSIRFIDDHKGYGLFAEKNFERGEWIALYAGEIHPLRENEKNVYCLHYPTKFFSFHPHVIDAKDKGNVSRFINHSQEPNLSMIGLKQDKILYPALITNRRVAEGEELCFQYQEAT